MKSFTLFIFRRDLRLQDNIALNYAIENFENILPLFIFTPEQIDVSKNKYYSENAFQFMIESLEELDIELHKYNSKLHIFYGDNITILKNIFSKFKIENVIFNKDYTPYSKKRDFEINNLCLSKKINCIIKEDYLLSPIGTFLKDDGNPYTIYTPFKNKLKKIISLRREQKVKKIKIKNLTSSNISEQKLPKYKKNSQILLYGGRKNALKQLKLLKKNHTDYNEKRNLLSEKSSLLSAYIKFGLISVREVYSEMKPLKNELIDQLIWREFYFYITYYFPNTLKKSENFNKKFDFIKWYVSPEKFKKWCDGETGYPIVDACMKELNTTGYMHNRGRLISSNFLNRILGMDWRLGERYFAQKLIDYDPSVNNGNWQWIASVGVDPKPFSQRIFNPILQSKRYDPEAKYIKKWLPNLNEIESKELHDWESNYNNYDLASLKYKKPIVSYKEQRQKSIKMYSK